MDINGADSDMMIQETTTCTKCSSSSQKEELYRDIQLDIAGNHQTIVGLRGLLDKYFSDEELQDNLCCEDSKRWRSVRVKHQPADLVLTLLRYTVNKYDRVVKIRTPVFIEKVINMEKYTDEDKDVLYYLKGAVIHHGGTPRSGHYTSVVFDGHTALHIDDTSLGTYNIELLMTDSYILRYEKIPTESPYRPLLPVVITGLLESKGLKEVIDNVPILTASIRKQQLIAQMQNIEMTEDQMINYVKPYRCMQEGINTLMDATSMIDRNLAELTVVAFHYLSEGEPNVLQASFGISSIEHSFCENCNNKECKESHELIIDANTDIYTMNMQRKHTQCTLCGEFTVEHKTAITNLGNTLLIRPPSHILEEQLLAHLLLKMTLYRPLISTDYVWKAFISPSLTLIHHFEEWEHNYLSIDKEERISQITNTIVRELFITANNTDSLLIIDMNSIIFENNYRLLNEDVHIETNPTPFYLKLSSKEIKLTKTFDASISIGTCKLVKDQVSRFMKSEFCDLNKDLFFHSLNIPRTVHVMNAVWYGSYFEERTRHVLDTTINWFDKETVLIPINVNNIHWILLVVKPTTSQIWFLDPIGNGVVEDICPKIADFLNFQHFVETGQICTKMWDVVDFVNTKGYLLQTDSSSCGAMICLYGKMIIDNISVANKDIDSFVVRQFVFLQILLKFYAQDRTEFGLVDVINVEDLDDIVHSIVTDAQIERQLLFIKNPEEMHMKQLYCFGDHFLSQDEYYEIVSHLFNRYFVSKKSVTELNSKECMFKDATLLNDKQRQDHSYAEWYVDCVLVKKL